jgi:GTPase
MPTLYGNTTGLSPEAQKKLERVYRRKIPLDTIATPELMRTLAEASREAGRQVGALVHRSGEVDYVVVGDATRLMLPDIGRLRGAEGRFRALRLVHTHLFGEPLSRDDFVDLVRLRLDMVMAVQLSPEGEPRTAHYAYNVPASSLGQRDEPSAARDHGASKLPSALPYREVGPVPVGRIDVDFGALIRSLEDEFARHRRLFSVQAKDGRAILVHVADKAHPGALLRAEESMRELSELARTAGVEVVDTIIQLRDRIDPRRVLGRGKLDEVVLRAAELDAQTLIFDRELTPTQASTIGAHADLKIVDRTQLILDIFAQRAESADGKLQVELAQLKYRLPRLGLKDDSLSRLTGGIGGRGPGETKLEIGRRRAKERVSHLEDQLKKLGRQRKERRRKRSRQSVPIVSIVGYTNAGKSTLLNTLTRSDVIAEDKLFATLDTRSRRLRFPEEREVIVTDTVGFIRELPKDLFAAFRATFEEVEDADLILHVVDASDPAQDQHIETTEILLTELGLFAIPRVVVYNKIDRLDELSALKLRRGLRSSAGSAHASVSAYPGAEAVALSAHDRDSTRELLALIAQRLQERWKMAELAPPRVAP